MSEMPLLNQQANNYQIMNSKTMTYLLEPVFSV